MVNYEAEEKFENTQSDFKQWVDKYYPNKLNTTGLIVEYKRFLKQNKGVLK